MADIDLEKITNRLKSRLEKNGLRFYDIQFNDVARILRIYIDKEKSGVTVDDCKRASKAISEELDKLDLLNFPYTLEVSSPGIARKLSRPEHYQWAMGKFVEINLSDKRVVGYLRNVTDQGIVVATDAGEKLIPYSLILKARVAEAIEYGKRR